MNQEEYMKAKKIVTDGEWHVTEGNWLTDTYKAITGKTVHIGIGTDMQTVERVRAEIFRHYVQKMQAATADLEIQKVTSEQVNELKDIRLNTAYEDLDEKGRKNALLQSRVDQLALENVKLREANDKQSGYISKALAERDAAKAEIEKHAAGYALTTKERDYLRDEYSKQCSTILNYRQQMFLKDEALKRKREANKDLEKALISTKAEWEERSLRFWETINDLRDRLCAKASFDTRQKRLDGPLWRVWIGGEPDYIGELSDNVEVMLRDGGIAKGSIGSFDWTNTNSPGDIVLWRKKAEMVGVLNDVENKSLDEILSKEKKRNEQLIAESDFLYGLDRRKV